MIHIPELTEEQKSKLATDFITDKVPLKTSAGFSPDSPYAGLPRQTFTLELNQSTLESIGLQLQGLYDELIRDCWPKEEPIPFDMIRFDAFLDVETNQLKIIELNTRNVGLHEVVEWLDNTVAAHIDAQSGFKLNRRFVENQKLLHGRLFGPDEPILYMSPAFLPRWTYYEELQLAYSKVVPITSPDQAEYTDTGVAVADYTYRAITKKLAWPATDKLKELDLNSDVRILQPRWMRPFGLKNYLQQLHSPAILRSETFTDEHIDRYVAEKDALVLKIIDGGNSKAVFLGGLYEPDQWLKKLQLASETPEKWVLQQYLQPPTVTVQAHGIGEKQLPFQLGIFLLPKPEDPTAFDFDITVKAYAGQSDHFTFDPSGLNPDIWFGQVLVTD